MPESKEPYYRRLYQRSMFGSITASVPWEEKEAFRKACAEEGTSMHRVLRKAAQDYVRMHAGPSA